MSFTDLEDIQNFCSQLGHMPGDCYQGLSTDELVAETTRIQKFIAAVILRLDKITEFHESEGMERAKIHEVYMGVMDTCCTHLLQIVLESAKNGAAYLSVMRNIKESAFTADRLAKLPESAHKKTQVWAYGRVVQYYQLFSNIGLVSAVSSVNSGSREYELVALGGVVESLHSYLIDGASDFQNVMSIYNTAKVLEWLSKRYFVPPNEDPFKNFLEHPGVYSSLSLIEIPLLAARAPLMAAKHGEKQIERVFENQLGLLMQSFGFFVVKATPFERRVDLSCTYHAGSDGYTILIDAKSTKSSYNLPVTDSRALEEYLETTKKAVCSAPSPEAVIIVSDRPGRSLRGKLEQMEKSCRVPVRFVSARELCALREAIPGSLPADFLEVLRKSPDRIVSNLAALYRKQYAKRTKAFESLVRLEYEHYQDPWADRK